MDDACGGFPLPSRKPVEDYLKPCRRAAVPPWWRNRDIKIKFFTIYLIRDLHFPGDGRETCKQIGKRPAILAQT